MSLSKTSVTPRSRADATAKHDAELGTKGASELGKNGNKVTPLSRASRASKGLVGSFGKTCAADPTLCCAMVCVALALVVGLALSLGVWNSARLAILVVCPVGAHLVVLCWCGRSRCVTCVCTYLVWMFLFSAFIVYIWHGSVASSSPWAFRIADSLDGTSSCTAQILVDLPYHPSGKGFPEGSTSIRAPKQICPFLETRWASATHRPFQGYYADAFNQITVKCNATDTQCPFFASQLPADYAADLGMGLEGGWAPVALKANNKEYCPGVSLAPNEFGVIGRGTRVCSACTALFIERGRLPAAFVEDADFLCEAPLTSQEYCWTCPGYYEGEKMDLASVRGAAIMFAALWALYLALTVIWCGRCCGRCMIKYCCCCCRRRRVQNGYVLA